MYMYCGNLCELEQVRTYCTCTVEEARFPLLHVPRAAQEKREGGEDRVMLVVAMVI